MGATTYMCKNRHGTYYARFIIPKMLREHFKNKNEIRRSLQTDSRKLAVKRARAYRVEFENIIDKLMSKNEITERARLIVEDLFSDKTKAQNDTTDRFAEQMQIDRKTQSGNTSKINYITFVDLNGLTTTIDTGSPEKDAEIYNRIKSAAATQPLPTSKTVSEYLDEYIAAKSVQGKKGGWGNGALRQNPNKLKSVFGSIFGNKPAAALTRDDIEHYIKIAYAIPKNFSNPDHAKKFVGITLDMLLNNAPEVVTLGYDARCAGTVKGDLKIIMAFLKWTRKRKDVESLKTAINAISTEISDIDYESKKRGFTESELTTIFVDDNSAPDNYAKGFKNPIHFWLPLIALYTGARLAEICQLHLSDIKAVKALSSDAEHWCFDINDDDDKKLKTKQSRRQIPIHKNLIDAGLLDFADNLRSEGQIKLFTDAARASDQFGSQSQWFGIYSGKAGITDKATSFHSFRHNFCGHLSAHHTPEDLVIALTGHQYNSLAKSTYDRSGKRDVGKLAEVIDSIDYGLIHPKWEK